MIKYAIIFVLINYNKPAHGNITSSLIDYNSDDDVRWGGSLTSSENGSSGASLPINLRIKYPPNELSLRPRSTLHSSGHNYYSPSHRNRASGPNLCKATRLTRNKYPRSSSGTDHLHRLGAAWAIVNLSKAENTRN